MENSESNRDFWKIKLSFNFLLQSLIWNESWEKYEQIKDFN